MANLELIAEAARRGILPADKQPLYEEVVRRGLIKQPEENATPELEMLPSHTVGEYPVEERPEVTWKGTVSRLARPVLEGAGAAGGAIVGAGAGMGAASPLTAVAGGALGYAGGKRGADVLDEILGIRQPKGMAETLGETVSDLGTGAALEMGGQMLAPAFVGVKTGGKWLFNKVKDPIAKAVTQRGAQEAAGNVLKASTSQGDIYAKNAIEAAEIEKQIPGLKFTIGQRTNDPATIMLERSQIRGAGEGAQLNAEQIAANNEALRAYYAKNFGGKEGLDDLVTNLRGQQQGIQQGAERAAKELQGQAARLPAMEPPQTGQRIVDTLKIGKGAAKQQAKELYDAVPAVQIPVDDMLDDFERISKPMSRFEEPGNVPEIFNRVTEQIGKGKPVKDEILDVIKKNKDQGFSSFGLRVIPGESNIKVKIGETIPNSYQWKNGVQTKKQLSGVSTAKINNKTTIDQAIDNLGVSGKPGRNGYYYGDTVVLVGGSSAKAGADYGEAIITDPKVLGIWKKPTKGLSIIQPNSGVATLGDLQGLRSELLAQSRSARSSQVPNERLASRLDQAANAVEKAIRGAEGGSRELAEANRFYRKDYSEVFSQKTVGDILRQGARGEATKIPLAQIPSKIWNARNLSSADDLIKAAPNDAANIMRDHAAYDLLQSATDANGNIVTSKLNSWMAKNRPLLKKFDLGKDFQGIANAQRAVDAATKSSAEFEKSVASRILNSNPESAVAAAFSGRSSGFEAAKLMNMVKGDPAAKKGLQKAFSDHFMTTIQTTAKDVSGNPVISNAAFQKTMAKFAPVMREIYKGEPQKIKALNTMRKAYEIATRNTKSPIGGGSDTAENILSEIGKINLLSRTATVGRGLFKILSKHGEDKANAFVTRALFDPEFAEVIVRSSMSKIPEKELSAIVNAKIVKLDDYRKVSEAARAAGIGGTIAGMNGNDN